jgi:nicotinate-nucleotide adenylyltransferase
VTQRTRIGIFGGAFDPPHTAHRALVRAALDHLALDRLLVIPTGQAWHKSRTLTPAWHRLAMARLCFADFSQVDVDALEVERPGPSYTIDTLRALQARWLDAEWFLLIGEDQARALTQWRDWRQIAQLATICVAEREDSTGAGGQFEPPEAQAQRFLRLPVPAMAVSATDIRARLGKHQSVESLVIEPVARYIEHHHLYQTD